MFYSLILKIKIIYLPKTQQIYKCTASGSRHHPRTNKHRHKLQPQSLDPSTNSKSKNLNQKKKKKNSKYSTKPQPNRSINDQTQPTIGDESCGRRRAKIGDCPWANRASDRRASIGELYFKSESPSS